jgi:mono/diheme cytochrome c family protein
VTTLGAIRPAPVRRGAPPARTLACAAALAVALAGCGAGAPSGRAVFAQACASCHSLSGRENPHRQGGDLLAFHSTAAQMLQFTREMPVRRALTPRQLAAVVRYVRAAEAGPGG